VDLDYIGGGILYMWDETWWVIHQGEIMTKRGRKLKKSEKIDFNCPFVCLNY
jgi:hypothetical protein